MSATKFISGVVLLVTACLLLSVTQVRAETEKGRAVYHLIKAEESEVGDLPGHFLVLVEKKGLVFYENGEVATISSCVYTVDQTNEGHTAQGYEVRTFEDGSKQVLNFQFSGTAAQEGEIWYPVKGTYSYVRGTGRFEGIQGSFSASGKRFPGFATYTEFTETYTLP